MEPFLNKYNELCQYTIALVEQFGQAKLSTSDLGQAAAYSLVPPGKCFRGSLVFAVGDLLGVPRAQLHGPALAAELMHAATLIHDDLPALDNDELRRGRATSHVVFGEATAILAGDLLFALAFQQATADPQLPLVARGVLAGLFAEALIELCDGQLMDLQDAGLKWGASASEVVKSKEKWGENEAEQRLKTRHQKKTGALIWACALSPFVVLQSQAEPEQPTAFEFFGELDSSEAAGAGQGVDPQRAEQALGEYGGAIGLLFQITDDILDQTSTAEKLGKTVKTDSSRDVPTYVSLYGLEGAMELAQQTCARAQRSLDCFGERAEYLQALAEYIRDRQA